MSICFCRFLTFCCDNNGFVDVPKRENEIDIASLLVRLKLMSQNGNYHFKTKYITIQYLSNTPTESTQGACNYQHL